GPRLRVSGFPLLSRPADGSTPQSGAPEIGAPLSGEGPAADAALDESAAGESPKDHASTAGEEPAVAGDDREAEYIPARLALVFQRGLEPVPGAVRTAGWLHAPAAARGAHRAGWPRLVEPADSQRAAARLGADLAGRLAS